MSAPFPPMGELLPHEPPMRLIDEVLAHDENSIVTRTTIAADSIFAEDGRVPALVMIEFMAQSVASYAGVRGRADGLPPKVGFLLGCRDMTLDVDELVVGERVVVLVRRVWNDGGLGNFECEASRDGVRIAQATLTVYQGELEGMEKIQ